MTANALKLTETATCCGQTAAEGSLPQLPWEQENSNE